MSSFVRMLEKPIRYFTRDFTKFTQIFDYTVHGESPFFWEDDCLFVYVRSGSGRALVNQTPYYLEPGSIGMLHSYHVFRFESLSDSPLDIQVLAYPYPEMVLMDFAPAKTATEYKASYAGSAFTPLNLTQRKKVESLLETFQEELNCPDNITPLIRNCLFIQLRQIYQNAQRKQSPPKAPLCGEILLYVASYSFHNISVDSVAEEFSLTPAKVNQELRRVCKENFQGALNHARLSNAYSMMLRSNISLSSLAKQAGFTNEASFYRIFQDTYKMTPQQYRGSILRYLGGESRIADDRLLEIEFYVLKNCRAPITCESCAKELFLSTETINQILQEKYGPKSNFRRFLTTMRLRYAEGLLTMSDLPICDVAIDSGFNSIHTFIRLFKKQYGMTPTEYRNQGEVQEYE